MTAMKIGILGTGKMGRGLGRLWAEAGHDVMLGSRDPSKAKALAASLGPTAGGGGIAEAAAFAEVVTLAVPFEAVPETLQHAGSLAGAVLLDVTNPLRTDAPGLAVGHTTSGAEEIAALVPGARIVKAFNHIYWDNLDSRKFILQRPALFYCGDDAEAKRMVAGLGMDLGFEAVDSGPLSSARYLEPLAAFGIWLATECRLGPHFTFALLRAGEH